MIRLALCLTIILGSSLCLAEKIKLANGEWAPFLSKDLKHSGYISHIVTEAFAEEGYEVEYVFLPWKRGFEAAKNGKYHGSLIWGFNEERAKDFHYSDTVAELGTSLFYNLDKPIEWDKTSDLSQFKIGGVVGYAYGIEDLEKMGKVKIERIAKADGNYKKLLAGRIDIVLEDTEVGYETLNKLNINKRITAHAKTLSKRNYSVIISKKAANAGTILAAFNKGLKKVMADGRYKKYQDFSRSGGYK